MSCCPGTGGTQRLRRQQPPDQQPTAAPPGWIRRRSTPVMISIHASVLNDAHKSARTDTEQGQARRGGRSSLDEYPVRVSGDSGVHPRPPCAKLRRPRSRRAGQPSMDAYLDPALVAGTARGVALHRSWRANAERICRMPQPAAAG